MTKRKRRIVHGWVTVLIGAGVVKRGIILFGANKRHVVAAYNRIKKPDTPACDPDQLQQASFIEGWARATDLQSMKLDNRWEDKARRAARAVAAKTVTP